MANGRTLSGSGARRHGNGKEDSSCMSERWENKKHLCVTVEFYTVYVQYTHS